MKTFPPRENKSRDRKRRVYIPELSRDVASVWVGAETSERLIRVLRVRIGDRFEAFDGHGGAWSVRVLAVESPSRGEPGASVEICREQRIEGVPPPRWALAQAMLKGAKMDEVLSLCAELGIVEFIPFSCGRSVPGGEGGGKARTMRLRKIAAHSAEVSGRDHVPVVSPVAGFDDLIARFPEFDPVLILWEALDRIGNESLKKSDLTPSGKPGLIVVGPEGGFEDEEVDACVKAGGRAVSLGPMILSAHHAAAAALAGLLTLAGDVLPLQCDDGEHA